MFSRQIIFFVMFSLIHLFRQATKESRIFISYRTLLLLNYILHGIFLVCVWMVLGCFVQLRLVPVELMFLLS